MKPVFIKKEKVTAKQSKEYKKYEQLLFDIEKKQQYKANINDSLRKAHGKINEQFAPLEKDVNLLNRDYLIRLDELATEIGIGKYNGEWFARYMADELDLMLDIFGHQDKVLSNLFKKYSGLSVKDLANDDDVQELANMLNEKFGFKVDVEELLEKGERAYFEEYQHKITGNFEADHNYFVEDDAETKKKKTGNSKSVEADKTLAKDARSIYMRLIKKFHPDLEMDAVLREQKNEIVKQVTKAYQENDFFTLLKLQITHLEDNETEAAKIADDMIKRYNKILQKQLDEINTHLYQLRVAGGAIIEDLIDINGRFSSQKFAARKRAVEKTISELKSILKDSRKRPKGWFKDQVGFIKESSQQRMMEDIFDDMFSGFEF